MNVSVIKPFSRVVSAVTPEAVEASGLHALPVEEVLLKTRPGDLKSVLSLEKRGFTVHLPLSSLFAGDLNPYFGEIRAVAREDSVWRGADVPGRDGSVVYGI